MSVTIPISDIVGLQSNLNSRAPSGGIYFPGVAGDRVTATLTNQNIGTDPVSVMVEFDVPATNPAAVRGLWALASSATDGTQAGAMVGYISTSNVYTSRIYGATTGDYNEISFAFTAAQKGQRVRLIQTRTGTTVAVLVDAVSQTLTAPAGTGTPPTWAGSVTGTYFNVGFLASATPFVGGIGKAAYYTRALVLADASAMQVVGGLPDAKDMWGSQVALNTAAFTNSGFSSFSSTATSVTATQSGTGVNYAYTNSINAVAGKRYRVKFAITNAYPADTGGLALRFLSSVGSGSLYGIFNAVGCTATDNDYRAWLTSTSGSFDFIPAVSGVAYLTLWGQPGAGSTYTNGSTVALTSVIEVTSGCIAYLPFTEGTGTTAYDRSTNLLNATLVGSVSWANPKSTDAFAAITASGTVTAGNITANVISAAKRFDATNTSTGYLGISIGDKGSSNWFAWRDNATNTTDRIVGWLGSAYEYNISTTNGLKFSMNQAGDVSIASTTAATAVNTGALKGANFGFSGALTGPSYLGGGLTTGAGVTCTSLIAETATGSSVNITTAGAAGTIGTPLYTDLNFKGYLSHINARIRSWDESGSTGYGNLVFSTNNGTTLVDYLTINRLGAATFAGSVAVGGATTAATGALGVTSADPSVRLKATGTVVADQNTYEIRNVGSTANTYLQFRTVNDANSVFTTRATLWQSGGLYLGTATNVDPGAGVLRTEGTIVAGGSIISPSTANLTLGTTSFGTTLTFASATGAATLAGSLAVGGGAISPGAGNNNTLSLQATGSAGALNTGITIKPLATSTTTGVSVQVNGIYGGMGIHDGVTTMNQAAAYAKVTVFNTAQGANSAFNNDMTPDKVNSYIVAPVAGIYDVRWTTSTSCSTGGAGSIITFVPYSGTIGATSEATLGEGSSTITTATSPQNMAGNVRVSLTAGQVIELWFKSSNSTGTITINQCNLTATRIGN